MYQLLLLFHSCDSSFFQPNPFTLTAQIWSHRINFVQIRKTEGEKINVIFFISFSTNNSHHSRLQSRFLLVCSSALQWYYILRVFLHISLSQISKWWNGEARSRFCGNNARCFFKDFFQIPNEIRWELNFTPQTSTSRLMLPPAFIRYLEFQTFLPHEQIIHQGNWIVNRCYSMFLAILVVLYL